MLRLFKFYWLYLKRMVPMNWCTCEHLPSAMPRANDCCDLCGLPQRPRGDLNTLHAEDGGLAEHMLAEIKRAEKSSKSSPRLKVSHKGCKSYIRKQCKRCAKVHNPGKYALMFGVTGPCKKPKRATAKRNKAGLAKKYVAGWQCATPPVGDLAKESIWESPTNAMPSLVIMAHDVFNQSMNPCQSNVYENLYISDYIPMHAGIRDPVGGAISKTCRDFIYDVPHKSRTLPPLSMILEKILSETKKQPTAETETNVDANEFCSYSSQFEPFDYYDELSEDALVTDESREMLLRPSALYIEPRPDLPSTRFIGLNKSRAAYVPIMCPEPPIYESKSRFYMRSLSVDNKCISRSKSATALKSAPQRAKKPLPGPDEKIDTTAWEFPADEPPPIFKQRAARWYKKKDANTPEFPNAEPPSKQEVGHIRGRKLFDDELNPDEEDLFVRMDKLELNESPDLTIIEKTIERTTDLLDVEIEETIWANIKYNNTISDDMSDLYFENKPDTDENYINNFSNLVKKSSSSAGTSFKTMLEQGTSALCSQCGKKKIAVKLGASARLRSTMYEQSKRVSCPWHASVTAQRASIQEKSYPEIKQSRFQIFTSIFAGRTRKTSGENSLQNKSKIITAVQVATMGSTKGKAMPAEDRVARSTPRILNTATEVHRNSKCTKCICEHCHLVKKEHKNFNPTQSCQATAQDISSDSSSEVPEMTQTHQETATWISSDRVMETLRTAQKTTTKPKKLQQFKAAGLKPMNYKPQHLKLQRTTEKLEEPKKWYIARIMETVKHKCVALISPQMTTWISNVTAIGILQLDDAPQNPRRSMDFYEFRTPDVQPDDILEQLMREDEATIAELSLFLRKQLELERDINDKDYESSESSNEETISDEESLEERYYRKSLLESKAVQLNEQERFAASDKDSFDNVKPKEGYRESTAEQIVCNKEQSSQLWTELAKDEGLKRHKKKKWLELTEDETSVKEHTNLTTPDSSQHCTCSDQVLASSVKETLGLSVTKTQHHYPLGHNSSKFRNPLAQANSWTSHPFKNAERIEYAYQNIKKELKTRCKCFPQTSSNTDSEALTQVMPDVFNKPLKLIMPTKIAEAKSATEHKVVKPLMSYKPKMKEELLDDIIDRRLQEIGATPLWLITNIAENVQLEADYQKKTGELEHANKQLQDDILHRRLQEIATKPLHLITNMAGNVQLEAGFQEKSAELEHANKQLQDDIIHRRLQEIATKPLRLITNIPENVQLEAGFQEKSAELEHANKQLQDDIIHRRLQEIATKPLRLITNMAGKVQLEADYQEKPGELELVNPSKKVTNFLEGDKKPCPVSSCKLPITPDTFLAHFSLAHRYTGTADCLFQERYHRVLENTPKQLTFSSKNLGCENTFVALLTYSSSKNRTKQQMCIQEHPFALLASCGVFPNLTKCSTAVIVIWLVGYKTATPLQVQLMLYDACNNVGYSKKILPRDMNHMQDPNHFEKGDKDYVLIEKEKTEHRLLQISLVMNEVYILH